MVERNGDSERREGASTDFPRLRAFPLLALVALLWACGSDVGFRRYEIGPVGPLDVLRTAVEEVRQYYTNVHGGLNLFVDEEHLSFETGYIFHGGRRDSGDQDSRVATTYQRPMRQKLYFRVLPAEQGVDVELLATIDVMAIDDPDAIETAEDLWKFLRQDRKVEEILYERLLQGLIEKGLLQ